MRIALAWVDLSDPTDRVIALGLAGELRAAGHSVRIVGPRRASNAALPAEAGGFRYFRVKDAQGLRRVHESERPDIWHLHVFGRDHSAFREALRRWRWPCVVSLHLVLKQYLRFAGGKRGLRSLLGRAVHVTAVSKANLRELLELAPELRERASVVYSYGSGARESGRGRAPQIRRPFILCPARLAPYKGVDILLMAYAGLAAKGPMPRLVLCGRDQTKGGIPGLIRALGLERMAILAGEVEHGALQRLMRRSELVVLPSRMDNFPIVLLEAMAAGKAVLSTKVGGIPELVSDRVNGRLVQPGDPAALARAMAAMLSDKRRLEELGAAALRRSARFSWKRAAAGYARLYEACLG